VPENHVFFGVPQPSIFSWEQPVKAIILARVSSKEQADINSIPAQVRRLQEYAARIDFSSIEVVQLVESSTKSNRHKFDKVIDGIRRSKDKIALLTDTVDRLQRDLRESVLLNDLRKQEKVELHFVRENLVINEESNSSEIFRWGYR
jgi:site-specific DNA recombinase